MRRPVLAAAFLLTVLTPATASAAPTPTPASATGISPHCQEAGYCLFSGTSIDRVNGMTTMFNISEEH
ncbi:MAG: hypothetical protein HOV94_40790, partial [Saccharothrix sp.]|nr:hypothetical protein [Saccharothrix sp.]